MHLMPWYVKDSLISPLIQIATWRLHEDLVCLYGSKTCGLTSLPEVPRREYETILYTKALFYAFLNAHC